VHARPNLKGINVFTMSSGINDIGLLFFGLITH